ncbi:hypothetical protein [Paenibacillus sp. ALJ109b]|uniref:hypothetical protein n=1 Tax=Paenibacillus sp. ALJ109b TaxID=2709068 RepID=UPI001968105C|nr:hypothetical protein [Paenibacillus sp. ALJ109b]
MCPVARERAISNRLSDPLATSSEGDGIDSEEAVAVAFVSEFLTFKKMNQGNLETTAIGRTIRIWNGHVPTRYFSLVS